MGSPAAMKRVSRSTGSTTSTAFRRQRAPPRRTSIRATAIWWDLPRLEPDRGRAGGCGVVSRAVSERHRRQAPAGAHRMRNGVERRLHAGDRAPGGARRARCPRGDRAQPTSRRRCASWSGRGRRSSGAPEAERLRRGRARAVSMRASRATAPRCRCSNESGAVTRTLSAGAGLIAATRYAENAPVWVVTRNRRSRRGSGRACLRRK